MKGWAVCSGPKERDGNDAGKDGFVGPGVPRAASSIADFKHSRCFGLFLWFQCVVALLFQE